MPHCSYTVDVDSAADDTYAYLLDFANQAEWRHDIDTSELTEGEAGKPGAVFTQTSKGQEFSMELLATTPPVAIEWSSAEDSAFPVRGVYRIEPAGSGSRITFDMDLKPRGFWKISVPFIPLIVRRTGKRYGAALRRELGGGSDS